MTATRVRIYVLILGCSVIDTNVRSGIRGETDTVSPEQYVSVNVVGVEYC